MSQLLIANYIHEIESLFQHGGSANEGSIRKAFSNLLDAYCKPRDLRLIDELEYVTCTGSKAYTDGTLKDSLRLTHGYWEAKGEAGNRVDNITDWGLKQFTTHYKKTVRPEPVEGQRARFAHAALTDSGHASTSSARTDYKITKEAIFHYTYAVLHHPAYREKYALNLKREFPRIPFYDDFAQWAAWGKRLMELHVGFEGVQAFDLERVEKPLSPSPSPTSGRGRSEAEGEGAIPKAKLKADKENGCIVLDEQTTLRGIPPEAWDYKLGNRSALEWVLDQYKETAPRDPTIREKFNTYRFADYKEHVIDLLRRVTTVSVETQHLIAQMPAASD